MTKIRFWGIIEISEHRKDERFIMAEKIIESIRKAEDEAKEIKSGATVRAAEILSSAQAQADGLEKSETEACKSYRDRQIKQAIEDAETEYASAMRAKKTEAEGYCRETLQAAESSVMDIVGRILRGDC